MRRTRRLGLAAIGTMPLAVGCLGGTADFRETTAVRTEFVTAVVDKAAARHTLSVELDEARRGPRVEAVVRFVDLQGNVVGEEALEGVDEFEVPERAAHGAISLRRRGPGGPMLRSGSSAGRTVTERFVGFPVYLDGTDYLADLVVAGPPGDDLTESARAFAANPLGEMAHEVTLHGLVHSVAEGPRPRFVGYFQSEPRVWSVDLNGAPYGGLGLSNTRVERLPGGLWMAVTRIRPADLRSLDAGNEVRFRMAGAGRAPAEMAASIRVSR